MAPVLPEAGDVFGFNRYAYASDNPIINTDPDGRQVFGSPDEMMHPLTEEQARAALPSAISAVPVVGDVQNIVEAVNNPSVGNIAIAAIGVAPEGATVAASALKDIKAATIIDDAVKEITLSHSIHGEAAAHAADAIQAGKPSVLTIDRAGAAANRQASIGAMDKVAGMHLDEYPPAMFREGGSGASVRPINPRDNMSAGACIGNACRGLQDGSRVKIKIGD